MNRMQSRIIDRVAEWKDGLLRHQSAKWNVRLRFVLRQTRVMTLILKHPNVPWSARLVAACSLGYILSPIQLIPSFIPVIGQLDDLAVLLAGAKIVRVLVPSAVLAECEGEAESRMCRAQRLRPVPAEYGREAAI